MKRFFTTLLVAAMAVTTSPQGVLTLSFEISDAEARGAGRDRGMTARPAGRPAGAKTRPAPRPSARPATRPSTKPASRPVTKPATRPATKPAVRPGAKPGSRPVAKPGVLPGNKPVTRPSKPGDKPGFAAPGHGHRPPGSRPPGARPPGGRPPGARPPGHSRPPGWHPPHHRPPGYRPPYYPPPYYRPPHYHWGNYYWNDGWGWFFTAVLVGSTLVYIDSLDDKGDCQKIKDQGETLYECDGVLYRSTYYQDEQVYEIVSDAPGEAAAEPLTVFGLALTDPMTRGEVVRDMQMRLTELGYDLGTPDGIFGSSTEAALQWFQYDNGLEPTGFVDAETARLLGYGDTLPEGVDTAPAGDGTSSQPAPAEESGGPATGGVEEGSSAEAAPKSE